MLGATETVYLHRLQVALYSMLSKSEGRVEIGKARKSHTGSLDSLCIAKITLATAHKRHPIDLSIGSVSISLVAGPLLTRQWGQDLLLSGGMESDDLRNADILLEEGSPGGKSLSQQS